MESKNSHSAKNQRVVELVQYYAELKVYQLAFESATRIFELSKKWPPNTRLLTKLDVHLVLFVEI